MIGAVPGASAVPGPEGTGPGAALGAGSGAAATARRTTLRRGSAERVGLLSEHLDRLVSDAEAFLAPSPTHPWYAGAVLLAGRGGTVALHRPIGSAVRYSAYDEKTDTGVELPPGERLPMTEDTVFDLASVSKLFTSILAVQQIERGALELEAKVTAYLPEFGGGGKQDITVRQLLTHTSGFRSWIPLYREPTREGKLRLLWNEVPANPPGSAYLYSDLNLISLQLILEEITARGLDTLLHDEISAPLGMHRTRFNPRSRGGRRSRRPRTPGDPGRGSTGAWCGARSTTRTPSLSAGSRVTPESSRAPGTSRSWPAPCSTAGRTAVPASSPPNPWR